MQRILSLPLLLAVILVAFPLTGCETQPAPDMDRLAAQIDELVFEIPDAVVAVAVRDPATGAILDRETSRLYHAASTMKVPVMMELYRQMESGRFGLQDSLTIRNEFRSIVDGSLFAIEDDSDDAIYGMLGTSMPIADLIDRMIVVSSNLATNLLIEFAGADSVQSMTERLGTEQMLTLRGVEDLKAYEQGLSNRTTASDLALLLEKIMLGQAISPAADAAMVEILIGQEFNEMIPEGLPRDVRVAHKTGQITAVHHDAGIVYPPGEDPFVLVILTEGIADDTVSARLGASIAGAVYQTLRPSGQSE